ncbi:MAG: hypothetical protein JWM16_6016 [Verrucomicrobiales bacterium]|nr:hypothetical protein [Verrucomicrobiales bacterium]
MLIAGLAYAIWASRNGTTKPASSKTDLAQPAGSALAATPSTPASVQGQVSTNVEPGTMEINHAVMVTVELDFGAQVPSIAQALQFIDRQYEPADGQGRTFAVLDAYGEPTPDGKKLHMSMHVSTEKPGVGALIFRKTGEVLWKSKIVANEAKVVSQKNLLILFADENGKSYTVDGSSNPASILEANLKELGVPLKSVWPDGAEREFTFIYSACGCPVKVKVKRVGERTERTKELPVMFPDDPAAVQVISTLMRWK